jgi:biotin carboxyl carrier protein
MKDSNTHFKVKVNGFVFSFDKKQIAALDILQQSPSSFNIIQNHRSVNAAIVDSDAAGKKLTVAIEGETFQVEIKDELDQMLDVMGFGMAAAKQIKEIKAPMPGMVLEVAVADGQQVNEGDKILILGAMKMENSIMIQSNATIKRVAVAVGQAVDKGQVLVELD